MLESGKIQSVLLAKCMSGTVKRLHRQILTHLFWGWVPEAHLYNDVVQAHKVLWLSELAPLLNMGATRKETLHVVNEQQVALDRLAQLDVHQVAVQVVSVRDLALKCLATLGQLEVLQHTICHIINP